MSTEALKSSLIILGLIGVLTFLYMKTQENNVANHPKVILAIQKLAHQDSQLNETILELKSDLFSNYDQITNINTRINKHLSWIKSADSGLYGNLGNDIDSAINDAERYFNDKMASIEKFKSHNAILKNSLYYLPTAIEHSQNDLQYGRYHTDTNILLREILLFNSRPNDQNKSTASRYIDLLNNSGRAHLKEISQHATTIITQRVKLQNTVDKLFDFPTMQSVEKIYHLYSVYNASIIKSASLYRTAMYVMALLMLLYVLHLFFTLRRTMRHLEDSLYEVAFQKEALDKHAIVAIINPDGFISYVNDKFVEISQFSKEEVVGQSWRVLAPEAHSDKHHNDTWSSVADGNRWAGEINNKRKDGSQYWVDATVVPFKDKLEIPIRYVALLTDITERKLAEDRNFNLAHYDNLTKLPNRTLFMDNLETAVSKADTLNNKVALLFLDLDNFKMINDTMGHASGDELLKFVADHLSLCIRDGDIVSRLGGDEFTVTLSNMRSAVDIEDVVKRILSLANSSITLGNRDIVVSTSIGISIYPDDAQDIDSLLKNADIAMYQAKADGKNSHKFFSDELRLQAFERYSTENELRLAVKDHQFELYYQPQILSETGEICAVEALIRWNHPDKGLIPPDKFIPILEDTGLIIEVGEWVVTQACTQLVAWKELGFSLRMAINVSAHQLRNAHLVQQLTQLLENQPIEAEEIEIELTESCIIQNENHSISELNALSELGIGLSLDDFGTGYSSLSYLKKLPINTLKIDRSFIQDLPNDQHDTAIATTILAMAKNLGLEVVAEGVETAEQSIFLTENGCEYLQGYYFSKPVPASEIQNLLDKNHAIHKNSAFRMAQ